MKGAVLAKEKRGDRASEDTVRGRAARLRAKGVVRPVPAPSVQRDKRPTGVSTNCRVLLAPLKLLTS